MAVHAVAKFAKGAGRLGDRFFVEQPTRKGIVAQADGGTRIFEDLNLFGGSGVRNHQADRVRASVNGCQLDGSGHS
jgi:hypothetical protein